MCSSVSTTVSPFRPCTVTGTISSANRPSSARRGGPLVAAHRVLVLLLARRSPYSRRRFSAVSIIPPGTGWLTPPAVTRPRASASFSIDARPALVAPAHRRRSRTARCSSTPRRRPAPPPTPRPAPASPRTAPPAAPSRSAGRSAARHGDRQARVERGDPADRRGVHRRVAVARAARRRRSPGSPVRASSPRITVAASSCARTSRSEPPNPPTGVRSGSQMTASRTGLS